MVERMRPSGFLLFLSTCLVTLCQIETLATDNHNRETTGQQRKTRGKWRSSDEFSNFDIPRITIHPKPLHKKFALGEKPNDDDDLRMDITAFDITFQLSLNINRQLIHPNYFEKTVDPSGRVEYQGRADTTVRDCYYTGRIFEEADSAAAVSTCSGIRAQIASNNDTYMIEPDESASTDQYRAYRQSDSRMPPNFCGNDKIRTSAYKSTRDILQRKRRDNLNWPQDSLGKTKLVELYIVNSNSQFTSQNSSLRQVVARAKEIVNFASSLYHPLGVYITIVGMETWSSGDVVPIHATDSEAAIASFAIYREREINPLHKNDNAHLLTSDSYDDDVLGIAFTSKMCDPKLSCAVISDIDYTPAYTATVMAHEIGHNFGMRHDNDFSITCPCSNPGGKCIMWPYVATTPASKWSQCSKDTLKEFLASPQSYCVNDFNNKLFDPTSVCGNGIVEAGEQCDCGKAPDTECNPACCSAVTCQLVTPNTCASGTCCNVDSCQLKPVTTKCRAASRSCDLAEYCSGANNTCPSDVHARDGTSCSVGGDVAYCHSGSCRTRTSQCQLWWGPTISDAIVECYSLWNVDGIEGGNCGNNGTHYIACDASNSQCGLLHCDIEITNLTQQLFLTGFTKVRSYRPTLMRSSTNKVFQCTVAYAVLFNPDSPDPGYVPNGAACGVESMCLDQECVTVSSVLNQTPCPDCNQHGTCNSLGQCHCDDGYGPPDCSLPGNGGSYHSNHISSPLPTTAVVTPPRSTTATRETSAPLTTIYTTPGVLSTVRTVAAPTPTDARDVTSESSRVELVSSSGPHTSVVTSRLTSLLLETRTSTVVTRKTDKITNSVVEGSTGDTPTMKISTTIDPKTTVVTFGLTNVSLDNRTESNGTSSSSSIPVDTIVATSISVGCAIVISVIVVIIYAIVSQVCPRRPVSN